MKQPTCLRQLLVLLVFLAPAVVAQQKTQRQVPPTRDSVTSIITKVPFEGRYYFITIVPTDTTFTDHMPIYGGRRSRPVIIWRDSLQRMFPDSILNMLRKRYNNPGHSPFEPRQK
jgi:hypothetical protein